MSFQLQSWLEAGEARWPWEAKARAELNDEPGARQHALSQLRARLRELQSDDLRIDLDNDTFLMAFLRARKFDVDDALNCVKRFYEIRKCKPKRILPIGRGPKDFADVFTLPIIVLMKQRNPIDGAFVLIWSCRYYDVDNCNPTAAINMIFYIFQSLMLHPSFQTYGVRMVFDLEDVSAAMVRQSFGHLHSIKALGQSISRAMPVRIPGLELINEPLSGLIRQLYNMGFKHFISKKMQDRLAFNGTDLASLHQRIAPEALPEELGGTAGTLASNASWLQQIMFDLHEEIVTKSHFGVKE